MKIAVIGAAGAIGQSVIQAYHVHDQGVRLVGRDASRLHALAGARDQVITADVATAEGCEAALKGVEAAAYVLGLPYTKKAFAAYPEMMRTFIAAAQRHQVKRLLLITNVYPYGRPESPTVSETHPRNPVSVKGRYRKLQEDIFLESARQGLEPISLRLPDFYGPRVVSSLMDSVVKSAVAGKPANLLAPCDTPHEFVFTPDVGPVVKSLLEFKGAVSGAYNLAGAGVITQRELADMIFKAAGAAPQFRILSKPMMAAFGLFMPVLRELREVHYLHETPVLLDDSKLRALLPGLKKTPYADGARQLVAAERGAAH